MPSKPKEINFEILSKKQQGYLFGLFEGDGYSNYNKKDRHYIVEFYLTSNRHVELIENLMFLLKRISLNPFLMKDKRFYCVRIKVNSKILFMLINSDYSKEFEDKEFCLGFVSGLLDAEGYINKRCGSINIVNTDKRLLDIVSDILNKNSIKNTLRVRPKSAKDVKISYVIHISEKFKSIPYISLKAGYKPSDSGVETLNVAQSSLECSQGP